jgi:hypothetical protein
MLNANEQSESPGKDGAVHFLSHYQADRRHFNAGLGSRPNLRQDDFVSRRPNIFPG